MSRAPAMQTVTSPARRLPVRPKGTTLRGSSFTDKSFSTMEKTMDDEVETVLRDWNENVKRREKETFQVRPLPRTASTRSRGLPVAGHIVDRTFGDYDPRAKFLNIERIHERDSVLEAGDDPIIDSSSESIEEDLRRPLYITCPRSGRKIVRMQFDVHGFDSRDIKVKVAGRKVIMFAMHKETESGRKSTNEFCRKIGLPEDVDMDRLQCTFTDGILTMEAPVKNISLSGSRHSINLSAGKSDHPQPVLNIPFIKATDVGQVMHINVEVGRIFRADDVVVKLRGTDKLIVTASREDETEHNTLSASLKREFKLSRKILPHSLRAGLTQEGILNVTAMVDEAVTVVINGGGSQ